MSEGHTVALDSSAIAASGDASEVVAEKPQKKQKRKVIGDASGFVLPSKKLRGDYQSLPPSTYGKSFFFPSWDNSGGL
nr:hypothetical protein [Tanacetum cinerariifolium]